MRILCVIDVIGPGGAQRQMVELAMGFKGKGHDVAFLTYHKRNCQIFNPVLEKSGIPLFCLEGLNYFSRLLKMRSFIRHRKFDAVLSFLDGPNFICEFSGIPFRRWKLLVGERSADPKIFNSLKLRSYRWFHVFADYIVANSEANMKIIRSVNPLLSKRKCKVIYNVVDFSRWKPASDVENRVNSEIKLIVAARHSYEKNLNGLLEALSLLTKDELKRIKVEWYGDGLAEPYYDNSIVEARSKMSELKLENIISFYPATNEILKIIQGADAVGLFSFNEGLPNAVLEGMACAKPVLCSRVSDIPALLSHDENLLFKPEDPCSIKQALSYLIDLSKARMVEIGRENEKICKRHFDKEKIISEYLKLLAT